MFDSETLPSLSVMPLLSMSNEGPDRGSLEIIP